MRCIFTTEQSTVCNTNTWSLHKRKTHIKESVTSNPTLWNSTFSAFLTHCPADSSLLHRSKPKLKKRNQRATKHLCCTLSPQSRFSPSGGERRGRIHRGGLWQMRMKFHSERRRSFNKAALERRSGLAGKAALTSPCGTSRRKTGEHFSEH